MADPTPRPEQLVQIDYQPPKKDWRDPAVEFRRGVFCYSGTPKALNYLGMPNPREWQPFDKDCTIRQNAWLRGR